MTTPLQRYQQDLQREDFEHDSAQELAVKNLQRLYDDLVAADLEKQGWFKSLFNRIGLKKKKNKQPIKGLYFWGGVGRGKTYLVDTFFECLPFAQKKRLHFHRFMLHVHTELKQLRDKRDPIKLIGQKFSKDTRILCFDEFVVNDVADAVILAKLTEELFNRGITLVATSNVEPKELYKGGLQRDLFMPTIDLIYQHTDVLNIDAGIDYRLRFLNKAETFFTPLNKKAEQGLLYNFQHLAPDEGISSAQIEIEGRMLTAKKRADGVIWFDFSEICEGPRSQNDYIELARCFHSILVSNVPVFDELKQDQARRFINLVDVLYDHNVNLIVSAEKNAEKLYQAKRIEFEFKRTVSRLKEMQSQEYLAKPHVT